MIPEIVFLVLKIRNIPYVAHIHADVEPSGKMGFLLPFYKNIFLQKILNYASKIVVPTKDYIAIIIKKYAISKYKIIVILYGVDLNNFKNMLVKLHNPIRLLFVGRLTKQKNIPLLIKSFKKFVVNNDYNIELHEVF
jgi:rhamnosyl/mannosyltransferase